MKKRKLFLTVCIIGIFLPAISFAGDQIYETMSASTKLLLSQQLSTPLLSSALSEEEKELWLGTTFLNVIPENLPEAMRAETVSTVIYEAKRAGLDPMIILAVIDVESRFRKYAISSAGARGYMQVMPFWLDTIGTPAHNLFDMKTNIRYGCVILRLYLDSENGNMTNALARYNGSLGKRKYPVAVFTALDKWHEKLLASKGAAYAVKN